MIKCKFECFPQQTHEKMLTCFCIHSLCYVCLIRPQKCFILVTWTRALARISELVVQQYTFGKNWVSNSFNIQLHYLKIWILGCPKSAIGCPKDTPLAKGLSWTLVSVLKSHISNWYDWLNFVSVWYTFTRSVLVYVELNTCQINLEIWYDVKAWTFIPTGTTENALQKLLTYNSNFITTLCYSV